MKVRDLFALPFLLLGRLCDVIAIKIGGQFTASLLIKNLLKK